MNEVPLYKTRVACPSMGFLKRMTCLSGAGVRRLQGRGGIPVFRIEFSATSPIRTTQPLGSPLVPKHRATVGSYGGAVCEVHCTSVTTQPNSTCNWCLLAKTALSNF